MTDTFQTWNMTATVANGQQQSRPKIMTACTENPESIFTSNENKYILTWHAYYTLCFDFFQRRGMPRLKQWECKNSARRFRKRSNAVKQWGNSSPLCCHWGRSKAASVAVGVTDKASFDCRSGTVSGTMEANALWSRESDDLWRRLRLWISPRTIDNGRFTWKQATNKWNRRASTPSSHKLKENWNNI